FKAGESENNVVSFYEYDVWNQLKKSTESNKIVSYAYNGEGYRVQKNVNGQIEKYVYEGDKVVLELDGAGTQTAANLYGMNLVSRTADSETAYYLYNGHADVVGLINTAGDTLATYYYDAFGNATETTGDKDNPYRYAGYRYDEETDVYYLNARYYDAKIARFMTEDTYRGSAMDPLSLNLYTYVSNNPIRYYDPTGHSQEDYERGMDQVADQIAGDISDDALNDNLAAQIDALQEAIESENEAEADLYKGRIDALEDLLQDKDASKNGGKKRSKAEIVSEKAINAYMSGNSYIGNRFVLGLYQSFVGYRKSTSLISKEGPLLASVASDIGGPIYYNDKPKPATKGTGNSEDVTRALARLLIGNPINAFVTQNPYPTEFLTGVPVIDLFYAAGFVMDNDGVYHARQDALQQYGGYNSVYDIIFDYATSMKAQPFQFTYDDQDYRFWAWKGDYLNLGAGAELGLYKRLSVFGNQTDHWLVDTNLALPMTLTLNDNKGNPIASYNPSEPQWWITAFNPDKQNVNAGDLRVTYTVDFSGNKENEGMFDAFYKAFKKNSMWTFDTKNNTATLNF
ncbi:MAG: repeat-associated core domain protein, partial [Clostridia bacterium]|nr:repeat-associated core domain protein [Clostridia bacterium]